MSLFLLTGDRAFSSWSMRARITTIESGVAFQEVAVELDWPVRYIDDQATGIPEFDIPPEPAAGCGVEPSQLVRRDPTGLIAKSFIRHMARVPVLIDDATGMIASDTLAIAEYLHEVSPSTTLLGEDLVRRAAVRTFAGHIHADYLPMMGGMSYAKSYRIGTDSVPAEVAVEQAHRLAVTIDAMLQAAADHRENRGYLFGSFSLADVMMAPVAQSFTGWGFAQTLSPSVQQYLALLLERPSVAGHIAEAKSIYDRLDAHQVGSAPWIAGHYRYNEELSIINNWRTDVYHKLENDVARDAFVLAFNGQSIDEVVTAIAADYGVEPSVVRPDIEQFFAHISPSNDDVVVETSFLY